MSELDLSRVESAEVRQSHILPREIILAIYLAIAVDDLSSTRQQMPLPTTVAKSMARQ